MLLPDDVTCLEVDDHAVDTRSTAPVDEVTIKN